MLYFYNYADVGIWQEMRTCSTNKKNPKSENLQMFHRKKTLQTYNCS